MEPSTHPFHEAQIMAAYDPANVTATILEGAFLQTAQLMQAAEQTYTVPEGTARANRVQVAINTDTGLATISGTIPVSVTVEAGGAVSIAAVEYAV